MKKNSLNIAFQDYSFLMLAVSSIAISSNIFWYSPIVSLILAVVLFASVDAVGYFHLLWGGNQNLPVPNYQDRLVSYRFIQTAIQIFISGFLFGFVGWQGVVAFNLLWWFGVCDLLYYALLKQNFFNYGEMFWLWWTPVGILKSIKLVPEITPMVAVVQSVVGILLTYFLFGFNIF